MIIEKTTKSKMCDICKEIGNEIEAMYSCVECGTDLCSGHRIEFCASVLDYIGVCNHVAKRTLCPHCAYEAFPSLNTFKDIRTRPTFKNTIFRKGHRGR